MSSEKPETSSGMPFLLKLPLYVLLLIGSFWFWSEDTEDFLGGVAFFTGIDLRDTIEVSKTYTVTASTLNQRNCGSPGCKIVGKLNKGDIVRAYDVRGRWVRVSASAALDDEKWVSAQYLTRDTRDAGGTASRKWDLPNLNMPGTTASAENTSARTDSASPPSSSEGALTYTVQSTCMQSNANLKPNGFLHYCYTKDDKVMLLNRSTFHQIMFCEEDAQALVVALNIIESKFGGSHCGNVNWPKQGDTVYGAITYHSNGGGISRNLSRTKVASRPGIKVLFNEAVVVSFDPDADYDSPIVKQMRR